MLSVFELAIRNETGKEDLMSYQAYLDNIKAKTGKTPADFEIIAKKKGLLEPGVKTRQLVTWLKEDFSLGHGHAMAIVLALQSATMAEVSVDDKIASHFVGGKSKWRKAYEGLISKVSKFGPDVSVGPGKSYLSLLRNGKKFGIIQIVSDRMDIGIKLKGGQPTKRFESAGSWNSMVTHRVSVKDPKQIDNELMSWLKSAYEKA